MKLKKQFNLDEELEKTQLTRVKDRKKQLVTSKIKFLIEELIDQLKNQKTMNIKVSSRSKNNIRKENDIYVLNDEGRKVIKTLNTKGGAISILKILKILQYILIQYEKNQRSTIRELYYNSLNWVSEAQFETVNDSNRCLEDIEILLSSIREDFNILAESDGVIAGPLKVEITTRQNTTKIIDCQKDVASSGFLLPRCIEELKIMDCSGFDNILVLETRGCFARLVEANKDSEWKTLLCSTGGQPSRCLRRLLKILSEKHDKKVFVMNDGDLWGFLIYLSISSGSIKSAHINERLCTPSAKLIGLLPSQIQEFGLPVDHITSTEETILKTLSGDPRLSDQLKKEVSLMLTNRLKAEQQSLMYHGLQFMGDYYIPHLMKLHGARGMEKVEPKMDLMIKDKIKKKPRPKVKGMNDDN